MSASANPRDGGLHAPLPARSNVALRRAISQSKAAKLSDYPTGEYKRASQVAEDRDFHNSGTPRDHGAVGIPTSDPWEPHGCQLAPKVPPFGEIALGRWKDWNQALNQRTVVRNGSQNSAAVLRKIQSTGVLVSITTSPMMPRMKERSTGRSVLQLCMISCLGGVIASSLRPGVGRSILT
ncbi:hypothetical protein CRG98_012532 [Punica granatum]|uniref:Uncharacterized protein n=1 Tax=Punica granatum TaxID=22663 RepID=A0A2I0KEZ0_PUNGR|nr:hypothetical protein CRG98_012532 [Punica granatum]